MPVVLLIALAATGAVYLVGQGFYTRQVAVSVRQVSIPGVAGLGSVQQERQLSMAVLADPGHGDRALRAQRRDSDKGLQAMRAAADSALRLAPASIKSRWATLAGYLDKLPTIRSEVDAGAIRATTVSQFYDRLLDAASRLFTTQARVVPDRAVIPGALAGTDVFRASDLMSRAGTVAATAYASGTFSRDDYLNFAHLVGAYHSRLADVTPDLQPAVQARARRVTGSDTWARLSAAEDALIAQGPFTGGTPKALAVRQADWSQLTASVSDQLIALTAAQAKDVSAQALADGNAQLAEAGAGSLAAVAVVVVAIWWARRQSNVLAGRTLVPRIRGLGERADTVVRRDLPALLDRVARGERVDVGTALPQLAAARDTDPAGSEGVDELDQVAGVLNDAFRSAAASALSESEARSGAQTLFVGIAYRLLPAIRQALDVVDGQERTEQDPDRLEHWFRVHHRLQQLRGLTESLIILAGQQPGRQWKTPQPFRDVLRAAISQANDYERISLAPQVPPVKLAAAAVVKIIHLLTQLLNNAVHFSSPATRVTVRSMYVDSGIVVEIEDRGAGMSDQQMDEKNALLQQASEVDLTMLGDGSQLGLWVVARLAHQLGVRVALRGSPYGGVQVIVLVPASLLHADRDDPDDGSAANETGPATVSVGTGNRPQPSPAGGSRLGTPDGAVLGGLPHRSDGRHRQPADDALDATTVNGFDPVAPARSPVPATGGESPVALHRPSPQPVPAATAGRPRLPERQPQQHLAPQLRDDPPVRHAPEQATDQRPAAQIGARWAKFQRGTRAGRGTDSPPHTQRQQNDD